MQDRACNFLAWTWMQKKSRNGKYILFSTLNMSMLFNGGAKESHGVNVRPTLSISSRFFGCVILRRERIFFSITVFMLHSVMRLDWEANDHTHVQGQSRINKDVCLNTHFIFYFKWFQTTFLRNEQADVFCIAYLLAQISNYFNRDLFATIFVMWRVRYMFSSRPRGVSLVPSIFSPLLACNCFVQKFGGFTVDFFWSHWWGRTAWLAKRQPQQTTNPSPYGSMASAVQIIVRSLWMEWSIAIDTGWFLSFPATGDDTCSGNGISSASIAYSDIRNCDGITCYYKNYILRVSSSSLMSSYVFKPSGSAVGDLSSNIKPTTRAAK